MLKICFFVGGLGYGLGVVVFFDMFFFNLQFRLLLMLSKNHLLDQSDTVWSSVIIPSSIHLVLFQDTSCME